MTYELFLDGFDVHDPGKYDPYERQYGLDYSNGRRNNGCFYYGTGNLTRYITPSSKIVVGFALKSILETYGSIEMNFRTGTTTQFTIGLNSTDNKFYALRNGGETLKSTRTYPLYSWEYVEFGVFFDTNGSYEVKVNSSNNNWLFNNDYLTYFDSTSIDNIQILISSGNILVDDLYIAYGDELKWFGDTKVETYGLSGNSTQQEWEPSDGNSLNNWINLNDNEVEYVYSNTNNAIAMFTANNLTSNLVINGIQINAVGNKSDAGNLGISVVANTYNTTYESNTKILPTTKSSMLLNLPKNPYTGNTWTEQEFNDILVGIKNYIEI